MVKATALRTVLLESAVNPQICPLLKEIVDLGDHDYFMVRAIEKITEARRVAGDTHQVHSCLIEAITSLGLSRVKLNGPTKTSEG